ncbi:hypothetical protein QBC42DRAFT_40386 [Cladorrhinum samala]|uniref:Uncharacterized protein n=1 Tax=Cladorrhinum samala TaxID=585594 RepID=A0AAV9HCN4_9PEZI|nr:hypothetical protein QBC42DRAFT_40386 [Cladorrhinum samala]
MYGRFPHGTESRPVMSSREDDEDNRNEGRAPRQQEEVARAEGYLSSTHVQSPSPLSSSLLSSPSSSSSLPMSADSPSPNPPGRSLPGRTNVDKLVKKLSRHNLQLGNRPRGQPDPPQPPPLPQPQPQLQKQKQPLTLPDSFANSPAPWPKIEFDTQYDQLAPARTSERISAWGQIPLLGAGEPIEVDEEEAQSETLDVPKLDFKRVRRQLSGIGMRSNAVSARSVESRLEKMIADQTQCSVRSEPLSSATPSTASQPITVIAAEPCSIEVDPDFAMPNFINDTLEVDPKYVNGDSDMTAEENALMEDSRLALRAAAAPSGVRKYSAGGVQLRYRLSVDAALRCQNVIRSRPRMRKRDKSRFSSAASSAVTSAVSSPLIRPSQPYQ